RAAAPASVTVTDKPEPGVQAAPKEHGEIEASSVASEQTREPAKPRSPVTPGDEAMRAFTEEVVELDGRTAKRPPERFSATAASVEVLARLVKLLTDVANINKSDAIEATPEVVLLRYVGRHHTQHHMNAFFYVLSSQREVGTNRAGKPQGKKSAAGAVAVKAIWLDVDVGKEGGYATLEEALKAAIKFRESIGLPPFSA